MSRLDDARTRRKERRLALARHYENEIAVVESRKGELPKRDLTELQSLRQEIDAARTERQTIKTTLDATRAEKLALKTSLQIQLDAAVGATAKQPIKAQIDALNVELDALRDQLAEVDATLETLRVERLEILLQERIAKNETTLDDAPEITRRKQAQAAEVDERRAIIENLK